VKDGIPRWLQHCYKTCYKKDGCHERWACMITLQKYNFQMGGLVCDVTVLSENTDSTRSSITKITRALRN